LPITRFSHRPLNPFFRIFANLLSGIFPKNGPKNEFCFPKSVFPGTLKPFLHIVFLRFPKTRFFKNTMSCGKPAYRVLGKKRYRHVFHSGQNQLSKAGHHFSGKSLFSGVFSMSTKKDPGGIASVKVSFFMRLRIAQLA
jgi:hypothetical protein